MTMKVTEHTIKVKRKKHPNDGRYPCRASQEILQAGMKLLSSISPEEKDLMLDNNLILDEEETAELFDAVLPKDIIGLGLLRERGFEANKYVVQKILPEEDYMVCENIRTEELEEISFQDFSVGFAMGFAEILYRDEKPFGVSEDIEYNIKISNEEKEEEAEASKQEDSNDTIPPKPVKSLEEIDKDMDLAKNEKS